MGANTLKHPFIKQGLKNLKAEAARHSSKKKYWFEDTRGKIYVKSFNTEKEARHHFMMEGDHMHDFGKVK